MRKEADYIRIPRERIEKNYSAIKEQYMSGVSLFELCNTYDVPRTRLEKILVDDGLALRTTKGCHTKRSRDKAKATYLLRYGVDNIAKLDSVKTHLKKINQENKESWQGKREIMDWIVGKSPHPSDRIKFDDYRDRCWSITYTSKKEMIVPTSCYYTDISFNTEKFNVWNSASIDHKMSILKGFEEGLSPDVIGNISNLTYCLRLVNSLKKEKTEEEFKKLNTIERIKIAYQKNQLS